MKTHLWLNVNHWKDWLPKSYENPSLATSIHYDDYHPTTKMTPLHNYQWMWKNIIDRHPSTKKNPPQRWLHSTKMTPLHSTTIKGLPPIYKDESTTKMNPLHKDDSTPQLSMDEANTTTTATIRTEPLVNRHSLGITPSMYTPRLST